MSTTALDGQLVSSTPPTQNKKSAQHSDDTARKKLKEQRNSGLKKCFAALVDRKQVNLELEVLRLMLRRELQVNLDHLDPDLATILPHLLIHYIKSWPGWQRSVDYFSGNIPFKVWYDKFQKFITLKLSQAISTNYKEAVNEMNKDKSISTRTQYILKKISDRNTQTDSLAPKSLAPFTIHVMAKPSLLNTIVFTDTTEGDVVLKQHNTLEWDKTVSDSITLKQIISWPHVGVHMYSPVFSFSRRNLHEFRRHVSFVGTPLPSSSGDYIEEVKIIDNKISRGCFTIDYIREMSTEFQQCLAYVYKSPAVLEAFQTVIDEFLLDIEEMAVLRDKKATIASNTSVLFNMGKHTYFRNKKLSKGVASRTDIGYTEIIIPKMETALAFLSPETKIKNYFNHLKTFQSSENMNTHSALPQITFSCSYCQKNFEHGGLLANHLKEEHKMEQPVLCAICKKSFPAFQLTKLRWGHACTAGTSKSSRVSV